MKKWNNPELKNLNIARTNSEVEDNCSNVQEGGASPAYLFCFGGFRNDNGECTHPRYGHGIHAWPCPQATTPGDPSAPIS